uniref:Arrowhead n=1 Tax=Anopheles farauti TaxID=69004 RepID=A0A182QTN5_9DIPT
MPQIKPPNPWVFVDLKQTHKTAGPIKCAYRLHRRYPCAQKDAVWAHARVPDQLKELRSCTACGEPISDKFLLDVGGCSWHSACLRCCICHTPLDHQPSCFLRERQIYCKTDYSNKVISCTQHITARSCARGRAFVMTFGTKCARCSRTISATDWVRRARDLIFHLACFACDSCGRQLSTGEQFALVDDKVLCKTHYSEMFDCGTSSDDGCEADGYQKNNKTKRVRTTFTEEQLQILQANFNIDSNPDGQDLERIASVTGLSKRVTQVWFQNSRARQKKHVQDSSLDELSEDSAIHCMQSEA